ncbi:hypothetical protein J437_LFUL000462 [Ladona fulva]|uniref:Protein FAM92A n=1 Tax=Ladona fulva TaxID=123851 RepID=A0A8K0KM12_LADFU|nr:hypothetical protein J437_LFUL000462 [Ladona fulva]
MSLSELQARFVLERVLAVEKNFSELCSAFAAYSRKTARLRDKGDDLAKLILAIGDSEVLNKSLRSGLMRFSSSVSAVGDLRDTLVLRIEKKAISELSSYGNACQIAKEDVKEAITSAEREQQKKKQFERIRERNPRNRQQISKAESEYQRANADAMRTARILEERAFAFEEKKLMDVKDILLNFIKAEVAYHTKALEIFTLAYQDVAKVEINEDLEITRSCLVVDPKYIFVRKISEKSMIKIKAVHFLVFNYYFSSSNVNKIRSLNCHFIFYEFETKVLELHSFYT